MKFSYTIVNKEGRKLTGTIDAENEFVARDELNRLGFPVLEMTEIAPETVDEILGKSTKFEFEAIDQNGRKIIGTISGEDRYTAFKRLVNEYRFTVEKIWQSSASLEEQEEEKNLGAVELYAQLKKETATKEKPTQTLVMEKEQEEKEKFIQQRVEAVLQKVNELFNKYSANIKDEERVSIQQKADRLLRLKTSSNIEYVRHLAEELLIYLENEENYLKDGVKDKDLEKIKIDFKKMLSELHEQGIKPTFRQSILKWIEEWKENNTKDKEILTGWTKMSYSFFSFIEDMLIEPPEISALKEKMRLISKQIFSYYKLLIWEKSPQLKNEIKESIHSLRQEKFELSDQLKEIQKKYKEEEKLKGEESFMQKLSNELTSLLGWTLFFYILYYFASIYLNNYLKKYIDTEITNKFLILLSVIFLIYIAGKSKKVFFPQNLFAGIITTFILVLSVILLVFNF